MALLARGSVTDRPWGMTLGALGMRGLTGQLSVVSDGKTFRVAFDQGAVVAAHSPLVSDAAVRLALTSNLVTSTQVADISRRMAAAPNRDELEMLAELARLSPDVTQRLGRRLVAQRAARTFSLDRADFTVEDEVTLPVVPGNELDIRAIIYMGAKNNLSEDRLIAELSMLGGWFKLKQDRMGELAQFGFTATERPALQMLVDGANLADMEAQLPDLGDRAVRAIVYALAACTACEASEAKATASVAPPPPRTKSPTQQPVPGRTRTTTVPPGGIPASPSGSGPIAGRAPTGQSGAFAIPRAPTPHPGADAGSARMRRPSAAPPGSENWSTPRSPTIPPAMTPAPSRTISPGASGPTPSRTISSGVSGPTPSRTVSPGQSGAIPARAASPSASAPMSARTKSPTNAPQPASRTTTATRPPVLPSMTAQPAGRAQPPRRSRRDTAATQEIDQLLANKIPLLDSGADYFTLFGLPRTASPEDIRQTYFMLARKLHPDRLSAIGVDDEARNAQRLMATINAAFALLNDPAKKAEYLSILSRGGEAAVRAEEAKADEMAMKIMRAEEVFRQGEMALRRDQLPQALEAFKQAVELQPNESEYQALLAWAQFASATDKSSVAVQTRKALIKAAEANDMSTTAPFYLGRVERMLGREKEALEHFRDVLRIKPSHSEAASEARILEQRLKGRK